MEKWGSDGTSGVQMEKPRFRWKSGVQMEKWGSDGEVGFRWRSEGIRWRSGVQMLEVGVQMEKWGSDGEVGFRWRSWTFVQMEKSGVDPVNSRIG